MVPAIRNLLGGFLFSGDDIYKKAGVLSGGERTRLAVARMLLRPSNTLLLDEPTNHLDLDSKDVLLDALEDYGGTLIIVSHDRYFVEKLATKIIEIGHGQALVYPGTYKEFLWHKEGSGLRLKAPAFGSKLGASPKTRSPKSPKAQSPRAQSREAKARGPEPNAQSPSDRSREARKQQEAERRKKERARPRRSRSGLPTSRVGLPNARRRSKSSRRMMATAGFLRRPRRSQAGRRSSSGADVGSRRPDGAVGSPAGARAGSPELVTSCSSERLRIVSLALPSVRKAQYTYSSVIPSRTDSCPDQPKTADW